MNRIFKVFFQGRKMGFSLSILCYIKLNIYVYDHL